MPWEGSESAAPGVETRQQGTLKLCVPCLDSFTIQELADKITVQWGRIYIGYGSLDIKELKTIYNERLDMEETVGAYFDDRKNPDNKSPSDEPPSNSIVRVYRFPPDPSELRNIVRFGSLMPESAARPRKRPHVNMVHSSRSSLHAVASIEECEDDLPNMNLSIPNKRQKTNEARPYKVTRTEQSTLAHGYGKEGNHINSQTHGTQGSIHQVYDSQSSTAGKSSNPYGTPTSLSLVSSQEPILCRQIDVTSIPDSPTSRRVTSVDDLGGEISNHDRERTKSESPEIELSVHDVLPSEPRATMKQTHSEILPPGLTKMSRVPTSSPQPRFTNLEEDNVLETRDSGIQQSPQDTSGSVQPPLTLQELSTQSAWGKGHHTSNDPRPTSDNIFDMQSDIEDIPARQRMHSVKRLEPALTATGRSHSPHAQRCLSKDQEDGHSLILPIHKTGQESVGYHLRELSVPNDNATADMSTNGIGGTTSFDIAKCQKIALPNGFNQLRTMPSHSDRSNSNVLQNEEGIPSANLLSEEESPSQVATLSSQVSDLPVKNWSHLDVEHRLKQALSRGRRPPKFTMPPNLKDDDVSRSDEDGPEEQKEARERRAEQRSATKEAKAKQDVDEEQGRRVFDQGAEKRKADEATLADDTKAMEEKARVEQLADAERETLAVGKGKDKEAADAKAAQEAVARENCVADKSRKDGKRIREEISKEKALAEEAEKTRLRQDGANQLKVEELQKQKAPTSSSSKGAAVKTPRSATYKAEPKARTVEQSAKSRTERQGSALGAKGPQNWAEALFQFNGSTLQSSEHIDTETEEEQTLAKNVKAKSSSRNGQKLRASSAHRPSPESSSPDGRSRKSLTPALPNSTVTKSPSVRGNLKSSSPVASVFSSHVDTPLRSALKHHQTPSALRRSVSFVHDQGENPANNFGVPLQSLAVKPYVSTALPVKTLVDLNNELALPPPDISKGSKKAPVKILSDNETSKSNVAKKEMVQQKLNVIRDNKLKGHAVDTPVSSGAAPDEEIVLSSSQGESGSESSSEDDMGNGHAKAGPSSRKKPCAGPRQEPVARFNLRGTPIDPVIENMGSTTSGSPPHPLSSRAIPTSNSSSHRKSVSRSPAQAMSETISVSSSSSSGSESESESEAESGSDSDSESNTDSDAVKRGEALRVKTPSSTRSSQPTAIKSDVTTKIARVEIKTPKHGEQSRQPSRQAKDSSIGCEAKNADDEAAGQQLQLESSQSAVPAQIAKIVSFPSDRIAPHHEMLNQGLNRDGRLPNGTRPAYYMYPKLSTLRKLQETTASEEEASAPSPSQSFAVSSLVDGESSDSGSNESSSSDSDEDDNEVEIGPVGLSDSPTGSKVRSGGMPGLKGVMKRKSAESSEAHVC